MLSGSTMKDVNTPEDDLDPLLSTSHVLGSQAYAITYDLGGGGVKLRFLWLLANINKATSKSQVDIFTFNWHTRIIYNGHTHVYEYI